MIPNAALVKGSIIAVENYPAQQGFFVLSISISNAGEKKGFKFLDEDLSGKEIKILVSGDLQKKLNLQPEKKISGEIKKVNPFLWRAVEDTFKVLNTPKKVTGKPAKKG